MKKLLLMFVMTLVGLVAFAQDPHCVHYNRGSKPEIRCKLIHCFLDFGCT